MAFLRWQLNKKRINILELRAALATLRWDTRHWRGQSVIHLLFPTIIMSVLTMRKSSCALLKRLAAEAQTRFAAVPTYSHSLLLLLPRALQPLCTRLGGPGLQVLRIRGAVEKSARHALCPRPLWLVAHISCSEAAACREPGDLSTLRFFFSRPARDPANTLTAALC